jgi:hypothetical protein
MTSSHYLDYIHDLSAVTTLGSIHDIESTLVQTRTRDTLASA